MHFQSVKALSTKTCFGGRPKILVWLTCVIILQSIFKRTQTWHPVTFDQGSLMSSSVCKPFPAFGCRLKKKGKRKENIIFHVKPLRYWWRRLYLREKLNCVKKIGLCNLRCIWKQRDGFEMRRRLSHNQPARLPVI